RATEANAGRPVTCPGCGERCVAGESDGPGTGAGGGPAQPSRRSDADQAPGFLAGMSVRMRWGVALLAGAAPLGLVLGGLRSVLPSGAGVSDATAGVTMVVGLSSFALLFTVLYGQGTGCPSCGRWWSRTKYGTDLADQEVMDRRGVSVVKSLLRTTYVCKE